MSFRIRKQLDFFKTQSSRMGVAFIFLSLLLAQTHNVYLVSGALGMGIVLLSMRSRPFLWDFTSRDNTYVIIARNCAWIVGLFGPILLSLYVNDRYPWINEQSAVVVTTWWLPPSLVLLAVLNWRLREYIVVWKSLYSRLAVQVLGFCAFMALFFLGVGATGWWNGAMDRSEPALITARVLRKHSYGNNADRSEVDVKIEPGQFEAKPVTLRIARSLWNSLDIGDGVQIIVGRGALNLAWVRGVQKIGEESTSTSP